MNWKLIPGFPDYEASRCGKIRSKKREVLYKSNGVLSTRKFESKILKAAPNASGYLVVNLARRNGKTITKYVHELVAITFHGPRPKGLEILHGNDVKKDNRALNLRYGTKFENYLDAVKNGKTKSKLNLKDIEWIRSHKSIGSDRLSKLFKVPKSTINLILKGKTFKGRK